MRLPTVLEADRYWRARAYSGGPANNPSYLIAQPWNARGFAYVFADRRGTGASFGTLTAELGTRWSPTSARWPTGSPPSPAPVG